MPIAFPTFTALMAHGFDTLIDVRSPAEFALDHIPGAINLPALSNDERATVGTIYKQVSAFDARKIGAVMVARNVAAHVEGPLFFSIHMLTDAQYADMFAAADEIAERIRALGQLTPFRLTDIISASVVKDPAALPSAVAIVEDLTKDHEQVAKRMHGLIELADKHKDPVTVDLITRRCGFHEKAAWMLRATSK